MTTPLTISPATVTTQRGNVLIGILLAVLILALLGTVYWMQSIETGGPNSDTGQQQSSAAESPPESHTGGNSFVIQNASVFDGEQLLPPQTVMVRDGLIASMNADIVIPEGIPVIDGSGQTLLPGLIDAHVHTFDGAAADALRFGVTTSIDLFSDPASISEYREQREQINQQQQADVYSAGTLITAPGGHGTQYGMTIPTLANAADARQFVRERAAEGADFIKLVYEDGSVYGGDIPTLDVDTLSAAIDAAHELDLLAIVHVSALDRAREAVQAGADGLAHIFSDQVADQAFIELAAANDVFVIPTLAVTASIAGRADVDRWLQQTDIDALLTPMQRQTLRGSFGEHPAEYLDHALHSVAALETAGVTILAGSDAPNSGTAHGLGLHQELWWLTQAGLSPQQALQAASSRIANTFELEDRGRIAIGLRADLLLVQGNPLDDINASLAINHIWKDGYLVDRSLTEPAEATDTADSDQAVPVWPGERYPNGLLADFQGRVDLQKSWQPTTDQMLGGQSEATLSQAEDPENSGNQVLQISGSIKPGSMFPWAGAITFAAEQPMQAVDASGVDVLKFRARGTPGSYQVMLFSGAASNGMPAMRSITISEQWQTFELALADFGGATPAQLRAIAWTAGQGQQDFELLLDDVRVE